MLEKTTAARRTLTIPCFQNSEDFAAFMTGKAKHVGTITFPIEDIRTFETWYSEKYGCMVGVIDCNPQPKEHRWGRNYYVTQGMIRDELKGTEFERAFVDYNFMLNELRRENKL